jgi:hypothetical protein
MKMILATALALGLLSSTALAAEWTDEETAAGVKKEDFVRYAFAGRTMEVSYLYALDIDCTLIDGYAYEISQQPEHGVAELKSKTIFPAYEKKNPRSKCNDQKVDVQVLTYKANAGYKGPDKLTYTLILPSGLAYERTLTFNVRATPANIQGAPKQRGAKLEAVEPTAEELGGGTFRLPQVVVKR